MNLQSIPVHEKYFVSNNKQIFGFTGYGISLLAIKNTNNKPVKVVDFFSINNNLYLSIEVIKNTGTEKNLKYKKIQYHYKQNNNTGIIKNIELLPFKPEQDRIEYNSSNFRIIKDTYKNKNISLLYGNNSTQLYMFSRISNCFEINDGLYFNVSESGIVGKQEGLYFLSLHNHSCLKISSEQGEMW